jgi:hypothetical protein
VSGKAGNVPGGLSLGNVRLMLSFDYALGKNFLLGARVGLVFFQYPGGSPTVGPRDSIDAAVKDGHAASVGRLHAEVRATVVLGHDPLAEAGVAPLFFLGGGVSEFDARTSDTVTLVTGQSGNINIWRTDGPFFATVGGGIRWALSPSVAATIAARVNFAGFDNGIATTFGPEIGVQYGF